MLAINLHVIFQGLFKQAFLVLITYFIVITMHFIEVLEELFRRHKNELISFATERAGDAAEDLVQESFLRLIEHPEPQSIKNPRAYLYKVTANSVVDYHRRCAVREKYSAYEEEDTGSLTSSNLYTETAVHHQLILQQCLKTWGTLPEIQRTVLLLHGFDGMSYRDIAKMLKISRTTVERYIALARHHQVDFELDDARPQSAYH